MTWQNPTNEKLSSILQAAKTIAVVGLSNNQDKTAYQISQRMQQLGYKIIPINPNVDEVLGEKAYPTLAEVPEKIDIINVFRRPEHLPDVAKDAANTDCRMFWAQQGIVNEDAYHFLKDQGFEVVMDLCIKVVHSVLVK
ncbi:CoA-binding protein [Oceanobacillus kimchii]|uniref:CoA-binding protein n=1 Tax=Oceanobacillus kimchii TaxID=746691 RepID=UPI00034A86E3|nr:CoA-binding protein [Oceanobacillus kimchii]MCT1576135.1 CoA-binding protein [Oceanobacillus kimchii]MCT2135772.1 CoA-binding protein [Oceanobacillus kimchii]